MKQLEKYLISNISILFLSIFLSLFAIASIIFMIKLATYTAIIQLNILEMIKLYMFVVPELLFFTLPISFFVSSALSLYKLSNENEMIVLFALGIHPKFILKTLLKPALLLTILLSFDFFFLFPHAKTLSQNFIAYKKNEAKFNLSASEFGHKFGDWLLYIGSEDKNETYYDVFLFNKNEQDEILIEAKKAYTTNENGTFKLKLIDGEGYSYSQEKFTQIDFQEMTINSNLKSDNQDYKTSLEYWIYYQSHKEEKDKRNNLLIRNILLSLFPLLSIFVIISISIVHARHHTKTIYLYLFISIVVYYGASLSLGKTLSFFAIPCVVFIWTLTTFILYKKHIVARF